MTIYQFDIPQYIQNLGGFNNPLIVKYFEYYADILFKNFGDRVKTWITLNEPKLYCVEGYGRGSSGPSVHAPGIGEYLCGHYSLLCHAAAYRLYKSKYYAAQKGEIGISIDLQFHYPRDKKVDKSFVNQAHTFIVSSKFVCF